MKKNKLPVSLSRALLITYAALFIGLIFVRIHEHKQTRESSRMLFEIGHSSMQRQLILTDLARNSDYVRVNFLTALYSNDEERRQRSYLRIKTIETGITDALHRYHPYIADVKEREMFNQVFRLENAMTERRKRITTALNNGNVQDALLRDVSELEPIYEEFHRANRRLSKYVDQRDGENVHAIQSHFDTAIRLSSGISLCILTLMALLGIFILLAVRTIIRKKSLFEKSERKYRNMVEQTHDMVATINSNGYLQFANKKLKNLLGYTDEELRDRPLHTLMEKSSSEEAVENFTNVLNGTDHARTVSRVFLSKDNRRIHLEGSLVYEHQGKDVCGVTVFYKDITDEKMLEEELRESERKFKQLFNMAPVPMYIIDPVTYELLQLNDMAAGDSNISGKNYLGKPILDLIPEDRREWVIVGIRQLMENDQFFKGDFSYTDDHGNDVEIEVHGSYFILKKRPVIMVAVVDITERKLQENRITKAIIQTQEEERYEIGSELHDNVCQILASAKMNMTMLKKDNTLINQDYYENTISAINMATEEIRNLSHRLAPVFFRNSNFEDAVCRLLKTFNVEADYELSLFFDKALEKYSMSMEVQLNLYRILQEQLRNIIKYARATIISIEVLLFKQKLHMRIADNGIGFDKNATSSGIGMANMKRRAEFFAGHMEVNTSPGEGCEVLVRIPLEKEFDNI